MKVTLRETYNCDYCNKLYLKKHAAEKHESICFKNPINDSICYRCKNFDKKQVEVVNGYDPYNDIYIKVDRMFCNKLDICLYPHQYDHVSELRMYDNEPTRKECEYYTPHWDGTLDNTLIEVDKDFNDLFEEFMSDNDVDIK